MYRVVDWRRSSRPKTQPKQKKSRPGVATRPTGRAFFRWAGPTTTAGLFMPAIAVVEVQASHFIQAQASSSAGGFLLLLAGQPRRRLFVRYYLAIPNPNPPPVAVDGGRHWLLKLSVLSMPAVEELLPSPGEDFITVLLFQQQQNSARGLSLFRLPWSYT
jgi:hypothetical protein